MIGRRRPSECGYVTAETALTLPILVGLGFALVALVVIAADRVRCADAAWESARALARGESTGYARELARRLAPVGASITVGAHDRLVEVHIRSKPSAIGRFLPPLTVDGVAVAPCESGLDWCGGDQGPGLGRS
jgi:hypothetical protein